MTDRLLLAFDGSDDSRRAAAWASAVAAARGGVEIELVHALTLPPIPVGGWEMAVGELLDRHESQMRELAERERAVIESAGVPATLFLRRWMPVDSVLERAAETGAGLIVLGRHGQGPRRLSIGSTSSAIARAARAPVVVVRGESAVAPPRRVVVALDGSPAAAAAATAVARWFPTARVLAASVATDGARPGRARLAARLVELGVDPGRAEGVELEGDAAAALLECAEALDADLLAIGRRGLSPLAGLLLGSVSEKLLQLAPCPLLVAH